MSNAGSRSVEAHAPPEPARPNLHYDTSLALHAAVAERLDEAILARARGKVEEWLARGGPSAPLLIRWRAVLASPLDEIRAFLTDPGQEAAWLRKASPFAGVLPPREREQILRRVRRGAGAPE